MSSVRATIALLVFLLITVFGLVTDTQHRDSTVTVWLQRAAPAPDAPASVFVFLGDAEVLIPVTVLAGLALLLWNRSLGAAALQLAAGLAVVSLLAFMLKHVIPHPGPPPPLQRHIARFGISTATPFSLPSGHTMRATFIAGTVLRRYPVPAGALVLCMMAALVYLGDHWTTDVLSGLCLGWACVELGRGFTRRLSPAGAEGIRRA